ncbi:hypothetical protein CHM34_17190 [Paludifilum halophilum]|uniref:Uncharacterized protein n=1 Tax=Paludifilum halophilum TaxID=1642702 RepID=A0A235B1W3_9BACL|nr:hypothetical protein CHM34_17190 [Paludifilum halophilum]
MNEKPLTPLERKFVEYCQNPKGNEALNFDRKLLAQVLECTEEEADETFNSVFSRGYVYTGYSE